MVEGASGDGWSDAQLAAFLMAAAIHGLDGEETQWLTRAMLESGEQWRLFDEVPALGDKHSTGGVGDKVSLILSPLLAACGQPVVMLTGRALGHTGGTADKLETIPGLDLALDRRRCLRLLDATGPGDRHRHRGHRAGRPAALRAARPHGDGRFAAADHRQHPVQEARHRRRRHRLRRQDRRRRLHARAPRRGGAGPPAGRHLGADGPQGQRPDHRHEPAAGPLGGPHRRDRRNRRLSRGPRPART